jgi:uncharacterized protein (TIGR02246 family)
MEPTALPENDVAAMNNLVSSLETTWNGAGGAPLASGESQFAWGHDSVFRSVYAGSTIRYKIAEVRRLGDDVALAHLRAHLHIPAGPLAGDHNAVPSLVMVKWQGVWKIAALHHTLAADRRGQASDCRPGPSAQGNN